MTATIPKKLEDLVEVIPKQLYYPNSEGFSFAHFNYDSIEEMQELLGLDFRTDCDDFRRKPEDIARARLLNKYGAHHVGFIGAFPDDATPEEQDWDTVSEVYEINVVEVCENDLLVHDIWKKMCSLWPQIPDEDQASLAESSHITVSALMRVFEEYLEPDVWELDLRVQFQEG